MTEHTNIVVELKLEESVGSRCGALKQSQKHSRAQNDAKYTNLRGRYNVMPLRAQEICTRFMKKNRRSGERKRESR
jgi:hypothetical protein